MPDEPPLAGRTLSTSYLQPISWVISLGLLVGLLGWWQRSLFSSFSRDIAEWVLQQLEWLRHIQSSQPLGAVLLGFAFYVVVTGLSLPGALLMTLAFGWLFGFWKGLIVVSFASTTGAFFAFLSSRYLFRKRFERLLGDRLRTFQEAIHREGAYYLFSLRLIPVVPFFVVNVALGLTAIPAHTYWWVSQLGMLPATAVYVYAGTSLPGLEDLKNPSVTKILSPQLLLALVLLGLFPLVLKKLFSRMTPPV